MALSKSSTPPLCCLRGDLFPLRALGEKVSDSPVTQTGGSEKAPMSISRAGCSDDDCCLWHNVPDAQSLCIEIVWQDVSALAD